MSFTVLVIPEDPMLNGHILKPLAKAIMADAGRPAAKVDVLSNPRLRGYGHAVKALRSGRLERYNFKDLWLFFRMPTKPLKTPCELWKHTLP